MSKPERDAAMDAILAENFKNNLSISPYKSKSLEVGQVRLVVHQDILNIPAKLAVVAEVNPLSKTCNVILLDSDVNIATDHDLVHLPNKSKCDLGLAIWCDFVGNVDYKQLIDHDVLGTLCETCTTEIYLQTTQRNTPNLNLTHKSNCLMSGSYEVRYLDPVSNYRTREFGDFHEICNKFDDYNLFIAKMEMQNFFQENSTCSKIVTNKPDAVTAKALIEAIGTNRYAKYLVRG
jgi:hypothetical protein